MANNNLNNYLADVIKREKDLESGIANMNIEKTRLRTKLDAEIRDFPEALYGPYKNMLNIYAYDTSSFYEVGDNTIRSKLQTGALLSQVSSGTYGNIISPEEFDIGEQVIRDLICTNYNILNFEGRTEDVWEAVKQNNTVNNLVNNSTLNTYSASWKTQNATIPLIGAISGGKNPFIKGTVAYNDKLYYKKTNVRPTTSTWKCKRSSRQVTDEIEKIMTDKDQVDDLIKCNLSNVDSTKCTCLKQIRQNMLISNALDRFRITKNKEIIANSFLENYYNAEQKHFTNTQLLVRNMASRYLYNIRKGPQAREFNGDCGWLEENACKCNLPWAYLSCPNACTDRIKTCTDILSTEKVVVPMVNAWVASFMPPTKVTGFKFTREPPQPVVNVECCINDCNTFNNATCSLQSCTQSIYTSMIDANTAPYVPIIPPAIPDASIIPAATSPTITPIRTPIPAKLNTISPIRTPTPTLRGIIPPIIAPTPYANKTILWGIIGALLAAIVIAIIIFFMFGSNRGETGAATISSETGTDANYRINNPFETSIDTYI